MADAQFRDLRGRARNRTLMAFAAGLRVIERSETVAELLDFLEFRSIGLMSRIVSNTITFVVKAGRCFRRTGGERGEDQTQDGQWHQESQHGLFSLRLGRPRDGHPCAENCSARNKWARTRAEKPNFHS